jgi:signal transduction histidine kinase
LLANRSLLCALAGPSIALTITTAGGGLPVRLTGEDLTRILVNLVKNSAEAMPAGGRILIDLREGAAERGAAPVLLLTIEDNGPGIPPSVLKKLFEPGITTHSKAGVEGNGRSVSLHRGLGLSITRSIVEDAGGQIRAANRDPFGACFQIELPVTMR